MAQKDAQDQDGTETSRTASHGDETLFTKDVERQSDDGGEPDETSEKTAPEDPNIVNWGKTDPENPMNWPSSKKIGVLAVVAFVTMLSPLASTMSASATPLIMSNFGSTNQTLGPFVTSVYILGYAFGPLAWAPLSELYGRLPIYNICNILFLIFSIACSVAPNLGALIAFRFFAGIAASCPITISSGTVADLYPVEKRGKAMASMILGPLFGPAIGPVVGGYLSEAKGWRWTFWLITILAGAACIISFIFNRETYPYVLLQRKTASLQKETGNSELRSALDTGRTPRQLFKASIVRPLRMLYLSPIVFLMSLVMAAVYGYLYLLLTTYPRVFGTQYNFSEKSIALVYLGVGVGSLLGLVFTGAISDRLLNHLAKRYNNGTPKPEYRLPTMLVGSILVPVGLFLYGWSAEERVHWIVPVIGTAILGGAMMIIFMPGLTYLIDAYTVYAASVSAAATVFRSLIGALLPLAGNAMYDALGVGWGNSLLGFIAVACIPVPLLFWIYGERLRNSRRLSKVQF
ncbi:cycloheximide resistance protein [Karstenula rhodostoma CBS 690.94]|uniref:Cycloheximide resistance protein n=1 Tax=Karstenula rhodostoma CBS 690.94 TaxID=1392251 RepID=A0A9P4UI11_9PLEO|nr:cycloheximide resistance protein [Karstenula rhodostoma CBS 690.94]